MTPLDGQAAPSLPSGADTTFAPAAIVQRGYETAQGRKHLRPPTPEEFDAAAWIAQARQAGIVLSIGELDELKFDLSAADRSVFRGLMSVGVTLWMQAVKAELRREEANPGTGAGPCVHAHT
ncbi:hypothetical protein [Inquilinus limosus]|uniref:Uncharacterized protein n=1 Tax=Inquilinus limosus TaxID=171674 RepID=A0A211ZQG9_9PROT|nr:hypothetical protein [Inquilinus limosus]OWJ67426.1 hypothetical protein BWR60_09475 [Inquilinus limosus]